MNNKDFLYNLISDTINATITWDESIAFIEYRAFVSGIAIVLFKESSSTVSLSLYDKEGEIITKIQSDVDSLGGEVSKLFDIVIESKKGSTKTQSVSYYRLSQRLLLNHTRMEDYHFKENNVIRVNTKKSDFIEPLFSQQPTSLGLTSIEDAQVVLISAPGATGKSALCGYMSFNMNIPIVNLAEKVAMGAYSVLGLLSDNLEIDEYYDYMKGLASGNNCLIVDAVDEGYARTGQVAFEGFLDDIAKTAVKSKGTPFVVFGRTSSLEFTALYLEEKGVHVSMLQIEPFTIEKAKKFIDLYLNTSTAERFKSDYQAVQDFIINEIGGFFKDENDLNRRQYERFIGYAPVLLSIATLLKNNQNYSALLNELQTGRKKHVELIVSIVEMLLVRDQNKIQEQLKALLTDYPDSFQKDVLKNAYSIDEQCVRIFYAISHSQSAAYNPISDDPQFNIKYEEACSKWFEEHPFMSTKDSTQNKVFESYILARIAKDTKLIPDIVDYIKRFNGNSYLFFDIFSIMYGQDSNYKIDYRLLSALMESFKMMDRPNSKGVIEIIGKESDSPNEVECWVSFSRDEEESYEQQFSFMVLKDVNIELPSVVSHLFIDAPVSFIIPSNSFEIGAPTRISCSYFEIQSSALVLTSTGSNRVIFNVDKFIVSYTENVPVISSPANVECDIFTNSSLSYPYIQYQKQSVPQIGNAELYERYQKMRRIFLQFRSHKKGNLGKLQEMIDNLIGRTSATGGLVLKALKDSGMIFEEGKMYIVNNYKVDEVLGLSYDDILMCKINEKVKAFLSDI